MSDDLDVRCRVRMQVASTYDDRLADTESAFLSYGEALREDATNTKALDELERLARRLEYWTQFVELVEELVDEIPNEFVARDLWVRVARVFDEELRAGGDAIERYRRALELDPEHQTTILALDRLYQQEARFEDLSEILRLRIEQAEPADQIDLFIRLSSVYETALEDIEQAISCLREVLSISSRHEEAISALERMFTAGLDQVQIGELLEPIYIEREQHSQLRDLLHALLVHTPVGDDRTRALHRLAVLSLDELGDAEGALVLYCRALREYPGDEDARREAARLAEVTGDWLTLVQAYNTVLTSSQDGELRRSVSIELASVQRQRLEDDAAAEQVYQLVLGEIDAADADALTGLSELYQAQSRWQELVEVLARLTAVCYEDAERIVLLYRQGRLYEEQLADIDQAVVQYEAVIDHDPFHAAALERLAEIHEARGDWNALYIVCESQVQNAEQDAAQAALYVKLARLAGEQLERPDDAIDHWNQVLELRGEDTDALRALEGLYASQESWREFADVCERQLTLLNDEPQRELELLVRLGQVYGDQLDRERSAIEKWQLVLGIEPDHLEALWALRDLNERTDDPAEIARTNERLLSLMTEDDERGLELWRQLGRLYQESLDNPEKSIDAWANVLRYAEHDVEAIDTLEELYTATENWRACVDVLERKAATTQDMYDRVSILFRVAEMCAEQLEDPEGSRRAYAMILESQPDNLDAYEQLVEAYEQGEAWEELVGLLISRLEFTEDAFEQVELYERTCQIFEHKLENIESAFLVLSQAFQSTLDDERFGHELARLAEEGGYWGQLIDTYQIVIEQMGMTPQSVSLRLRVASWWDEKLGESQHAATHYQNVIEIEEDNLIALSALKRSLSDTSGGMMQCRSFNEKSN